MSTIKVCQNRRANQKMGLNSVSALSNNDKRDLLRLVMGRLAFIDRVAVALRFWENDSIQEISDFLGTDWDETDRRINRSVKMLRHALNEFTINQTESSVRKKQCFETQAA